MYAYRPSSTWLDEAPAGLDGNGAVERRGRTEVRNAAAVDTASDASEDDEV